MKEDLITKCRPKKFEDFWTSPGPVSDVRKFICDGSLPLSLVFAGPYGTGKTSLALLISRTCTCENPTNGNPCLTCFGCSLYDEQEMDTSIMGHGTRLLLHGAFPAMKSFKKFCWSCRRVLTAKENLHNVIILDEAHELRERQQAKILPMLELTKNATFIFCTTRVDKIDGAILARSHTFELPLPTKEEAVYALMRIAQIENIPLTSDQAAKIAVHRNCVPRECLKDLQSIRGKVSSSR